MEKRFCQDNVFKFLHWFLLGEGKIFCNLNIQGTYTVLSVSKLCNIIHVPLLVRNVCKSKSVKTERKKLKCSWKKNNFSKTFFSNFFTDDEKKL